MKKIGGMALLACWASSGCVHTGFVSTSDLRPPVRPETCALDVVLDGRPEQPYFVIGRVSVDSSMPGLLALGENQEAVIRRLKEKACTTGAHVMFDVTAATSGQWGDESYSKSTTGSAVVAVYVDVDGRALPPRDQSIAQH